MNIAITPATIATGQDMRPYLARRGLSPGTVMAFNVRLGTDYYPDLGRQEKGVRFPYRQGYKARALSSKSFVSSKDFQAAFFNAERVSTEVPGTVYITEGEIDCMSLVEAGIPINQVLSVPTGARAKPSEDPFNSKCFEYVRKALANGLGKAKKFVWVGDDDQPGLALRSDMARIVGAARFRFISWPEGIKDANEMLVKQGGEALLELVRDGSLEWPVDGLYSLAELPDPPRLVIWDPGFEWGPKIKLAQRSLCVLTGKPQTGKTLLSAQMIFNIVKGYGVPAAVASFETRAKPHYQRILRQLYHNKLEQFQTPDEIARADSFINDWYRFLVHNEERPTLGWLLDIAEVAVIRHGARIITIDPWNRLEHNRDTKESETNYIGKCLRELHCFAHDMNCHVQIVAHPAKQEALRRDRAPDLEDISGSMNWYNMVDQGFAIHREKRFEGVDRRTDAILYHLKARFSELGWPCEVNINYDLSTESYVAC